MSLAYRLTGSLPTSRPIAIQSGITALAGPAGEICVTLASTVRAKPGRVKRLCRWRVGLAARSRVGLVSREVVRRAAGRA